MISEGGVYKVIGSGELKGPMIPFGTLKGAVIYIHEYGDGFMWDEFGRCLNTPIWDPHPRQFYHLTPAESGKSIERHL